MQPEHPKIYHIVHVNRLPSIIDEGRLLSDAEMARRAAANLADGMGTPIGMSAIKERRRTENMLMTHEDLFVGQCVPFYFCPRSVMLFMIDRANDPQLEYDGGQEPIIHLEADLRETVGWAAQNARRWAFTLSNAGAYYFEERADLDQLGEINWEAVSARDWGGSGIDSSVKEDKQAEFLLEQEFPWELVTRIGVSSKYVDTEVRTALSASDHIPDVEIKRDWYY